MVLCPVTDNTKMLGNVEVMGDCSVHVASKAHHAALLLNTLIYKLQPLTSCIQRQTPQ